MRRMKAMKSQKGFTLVEIIISIAFLCIVCAVVLRIFVLSGNLNGEMQDRETASLMAINAMEAAKAAGRPDEIDHAFSASDKRDDVWFYMAYYDGDWNIVEQGENPVFYMEMSISPSDSRIVTKNGFGPGADDASKTLSGLYFIEAKAGDMEGLKEAVVIYKTAKHYVYGEEE